MAGPGGSDSTDFVNSGANENGDKAGTLRELTGRESETEDRPRRVASKETPAPILFRVDSWRNAGATVLPIIRVVPGNFRKQLSVLTVRRETRETFVLSLHIAD